MVFKTKLMQLSVLILKFGDDNVIFSMDEPQRDPFDPEAVRGIHLAALDLPALGILD